LGEEEEEEKKEKRKKINKSIENWLAIIVSAEETSRGCLEHIIIQCRITGKTKYWKGRRRSTGEEGR
jgi:hypothetical protein